MARQEMVNWLSHKNELGKKPNKIICTKTFEYLNMTYYIFKVKRKLFDKKWFLAVCGGYEREGVESCGHIFSDYKEYNQDTEIDDAIALVEMIRDYWKSLAG